MNVLHRSVARATIGVVAAVGAVVPVVVVASPAMAVCSLEGHAYKAPDSGRKVWIPTTLAAGPYQRGGTQSVTVEEGEQYSLSKGRQNQVGGELGGSFGIGSASVSYNHTWSRETSRSTSKSQTYTTTSPSLPNDVDSRWTLYKLGWRYKIKHIAYYTNGCDNRVSYHMVITPTRNWGNSHLSWRIQRRPSAGKWYYAS